MSIAERVLARGSSALVTIALAFFASPSDIGNYSFAVLFLTLVQATSDLTQRQVAVSAFNFDGGEHFVRRAAATGAVVSAGLMSSVVVWVSIRAGSPGFVWQLAPFIAVPLISGVGVSHIGRLERTNGGWAVLARSRTVGSAVSVIAALPMLLVPGVIAASAQTLVAEAVFVGLALLAHADHPQAQLGRQPLLRRLFVPTAVLNLFQWSQGQLERLILAGLGTTAALGVYSLAAAVARSAVEAVTNGMANSFRARVAGAVDDEPNLRAVLRGGLRSALLIAVALQFLTSFVCLFAFKVALPVAWRPAYVPSVVLASASVPVAVATATSGYLVARGEARRIFTAQLVSVALSVVVGWSLSKSLALGSFVALGRESLGAAWRYHVLMKWLGGERMCLPLIALSAGASAVILAGFLLLPAFA